MRPARTLARVSPGGNPTGGGDMNGRESIEGLRGPRSAAGSVRRRVAWTPGLAMLAAGLFAGAAQGAFHRLDDFQDDTQGTLDGASNAAGAWVTSPAASPHVTVAAEGTNRFLRWRAASASTSHRFAGPLGALAVSNGTTATLYLRFRQNGDGGYQRFGLWDQGATSAAAVGTSSIDTQWIVLDDTGAATERFRLVSREPSGGVTVENTLATGAWYTAWFVIRNGTDTCDIHLEGGAYTTRTQIATNRAFRNPVTGVLDAFVGEGYLSPTFEVTTDVDDIHIDPDGENLARPGETPEALHYDVYLVGGQSNADGRGATNDLAGALAAWAVPRGDVRIFYANPINSDPVNPSYRSGWGPLRPGLSVAPGYSGALPSPTFGPEVSFGGTLADRHPERHIALIKVTRGGTSLHTDWDPDGAANILWQTFTNQVPAALQSLTNAGHTATLRGMIWHQGESDGGNANYAADLAAFIAAVRSFTGVTNLPFAIGELERDPQAPERTAVLAAMADVAAADPYAGLVSSEGFLTSDGTHFTAPYQIEFGKRFADAIEDIDADGMADEWETDRFGSILVSAGGRGDDQDGDGFPDIAEHIAGTDPMSPASHLAVGTPPEPPGASGDLVLSWASVSGLVYRVARATDPGGAWTNITGSLPATAPLNTHTVSVQDAAGPVFHRIHAARP